MNLIFRNKIKTIIVGLVTVLILTFLLWEHFHGGVTSHHILHSKDLPAISNWWSGLLLPILTWFLLGREEKRLDQNATVPQQSNRAMSKVVWIFIVGLVLGIVLAASFTYAFRPFLDNVLYILIVLSFFIPLFYAEFILGFILGMTYTFGAILPTVFILVIAGIGWVIYRYIRPLILRLGNKN
jgi:hypothetical protein